MSSNPELPLPESVIEGKLIIFFPQLPEEWSFSKTFADSLHRIESIPQLLAP